MTARISALRLAAFDQLPKHARRCVFWEVDPDTLHAGGDVVLSDPEFEKEAWLSMVMLEWGSCGQVAVTDSAAGSAIEDLPYTAYALYAPPSAVPRATRFPSGPVSADAVLLTSVGTDGGDTAADETLAAELVVQVVGDLVRRGVRALEAFGRTGAADIREAEFPEDSRRAVESVGDCTSGQCMLTADFLLDAGFAVVGPHPYFPRLRLELDRGLGWKADVEAALDRLLESAKVPQLATAGGVLVSPS